MAEEAGFEPARACAPIGFRDRPLQPLGYSSMLIYYAIIKKYCKSKTVEKL